MEELIKSLPFEERGLFEDWLVIQMGKLDFDDPERRFIFNFLNEIII